jgi:Trypsin
MVPTIPDDWQLNLRAGVHDLRDMDDTVQIRYFDGFHMYPGFVPSVASAFDIALLRVTEPFVFNDYVQPINLPPQDYVSLRFTLDSEVFCLGMTQRIPVDPWDPETPPSLPDILQVYGSMSLKSFSK